MKVLCAVVLLSSMLFGQVLYEEYFTGGAAQLTWAPWVIYTELDVISDPTTPGGDSWVGSVSNDSAPIAAMYAGDYGLTDYAVEAWIYTTVSAAMGPYNGICIRIDTAVNALYQLVSDFDNSARLMLRHIAGATPTVIREWTGAEIPGGVPASSSWHKFKLEMIADSIWAYYDDVLLPDCPFIDDQVTKGFFGIYFFSIMGGGTRCDNIIATAVTGIAGYGSSPAGSFAVYPNPFTNTTQIRYSILDSGSSIRETALHIYDATGRFVTSLYPVSSIQDQGSVVVWDGRDARGNLATPGVYFITDGTGSSLQKVVRLN
ncbi:T9SS type A sorting domain-containing protein [candidate division WOR-3 bacterium]|nr:T9SS type A sorting domain-containing protein [candidate division WOR-3 bacterium]